MEASSTRTRRKCREMASVTLTLIFDDLELGTGLANIARLSFRLGELSMARQWLSDSEDCYSRAERFALNLSSAVEKRAAAERIFTLRLAIRETYRDCGTPDFDGTVLAGLITT